ncbi:MAG: YhbY family RNA-binding protein [Candidatus Bathyarchaeia archaeon]
MRRTDKNTASEEKGEAENAGKPAAAKKRLIKRKLSEEKPTVWVGKGGASAELLKEIDKQLSKKETVKASILKSALSEHEGKQVASRIADHTGASLVEARGHTFTLYRSRDKEKP